MTANSSVLRPGRDRRTCARDDAGFTLVEVLTVAVIIGILAAIAISTFLTQTAKASDATTRADIRNIASLEESYLTGQASYATATQLAATSRVPASTGDTIWVYIAGSRGYCLVGHSSGGLSYLVWDSRNGGLRSRSYPTQAAAAAYCTGAGYTPAGTVSNTGNGVSVT